MIVSLRSYWHGVEYLGWAALLMLELNLLKGMIKYDTRTGTNVLFFILSYVGELRHHQVLKTYSFEILMLLKYERYIHSFIHSFIHFTWYSPFIPFDSFTCKWYTYDWNVLGECSKAKLWLKLLWLQELSRKIFNRIYRHIYDLPD